MKFEILAPSGDFDSFIKAVEGGADAVYLGLKKFNARRPAGNFTKEEYEKALLIADEKGVKIYVTLNIDIKPEETETLYQFLYYLSQHKPHAVIVKDLATVYTISEHFPELNFHLSTQFGICNSYGMRAARDLGAERVILARELNISELTELKNITEPEKEIFSQGSMCFSFSGRCLLSSWVGGKSANRGACQAPCRVSYTSDDGSKIPFFSMSDLSLVDKLEKLQDLNIVSLKIEGRLKNPEWVYNMVKSYKSALSGGKVSDELEKFSGRYTSTGFLYGTENLCRGNNPEYGKYLGNVTDVQDGKVYLDFDSKEDGTSLRFTADKKFSGIIHDCKIERDSKGNYVVSDIKLNVGCKIFEVSVFQKKDKPSGKKFDVIISIDNGNVILNVIHESGSFEVVEKYKQVIKAKRGLDSYQIEDRLLNDNFAGYKVRNIEILQENLLVSKSQLNNLCKSISRNFENEYKKASLKESDIEIPTIYVNRGEEIERKVSVNNKNVSSVRLNSCDVEEFISKVSKDNFNEIIIEKPLEYLDNIIKWSKDYNIVISLFPIMFEDDIIKYQKFIDKLPDIDISFEINDLSHLKLLENRSFKLISGYGLAPYNHISAKYLKSMGIDEVTIPLEADLPMIEKLLQTQGVGFRLTYYSRPPLFYTRVSDKEIEDNSFIDSFSNKLLTHRTHEMTVFYPDIPFSLSTLDLNKITVDTLTCDLIYEENPVETFMKLKNKGIEGSFFNILRHLS